MTPSEKNNEAIGPRRRVLIVDEDKLLTWYFNDCLHPYYDIQVANTPPEAADYIKRSPPFEFIIYDPCMAALDSLMFLEMIRQYSPYAVLFLATENADQLIEESPTSYLYFSGRISKPFFPSQVLAKLSDIVSWPELPKIIDVCSHYESAA